MNPAALRLIKNVPLIDDVAIVDSLLAETEALTKIFVASIRTAEGNRVREMPEAVYGLPVPDLDVRRSVFDVQR